MNMIIAKDRIRPKLDELVPSRYAVRVGDIEVLVISDGVVAPSAKWRASLRSIG